MGLSQGGMIVSGEAGHDSNSFRLRQNVKTPAPQFYSEVLQWI